MTPGDIALNFLDIIMIDILTDTETFHTIYIESGTQPYRLCDIEALKEWASNGGFFVYSVYHSFQPSFAYQPKQIVSLMYDDCMWKHIDKPVDFLLRQVCENVTWFIRIHVYSCFPTASRAFYTLHHERHSWRFWTRGFCIQ